MMFYSPHDSMSAVHQDLIETCHNENHFTPQTSISERLRTSVKSGAINWQTQTSVSENQVTCKLRNQIGTTMQACKSARVREGEARRSDGRGKARARTGGRDEPYVKRAGRIQESDAIYRVITRPITVNLSRRRVQCRSVAVSQLSSQGRAL